MSDSRELLQVQVESLRSQKGMSRLKISEASQLMMEFIKENEDTDHFVNPDFPKDKKQNPWVEQKKCIIL